MSNMTLDTSSDQSLNRIKAAVNTRLEIMHGVRDGYLKDCAVKKPTTKAEKSKHLHLGSLGRLQEVTSQKGELPIGHYNVGSVLLAKREFWKGICFGGKELRYSAAFPVDGVAQRLMESYNVAWDEAWVEAACGPMMVGDECAPKFLYPDCCIEHDETGITPQKIARAVSILKQRTNGQAMPIIPMTWNLQEQLTRFPEWTNWDYICKESDSAWCGNMMKVGGFYGAKFKMVSDYLSMEDPSTQECKLSPILKAEPYRDADGNIVPGKFIRHLPVMDARNMQWEEGFAPSVDFFDVTQQRRKPKGTKEMRLDTEFGVGRTDNCAVVIIKVVEENKDLVL